jgi:hypothetical protein
VSSFFALVVFAEQFIPILLSALPRLVLFFVEIFWVWRRVKRRMPSILNGT